MLKLLRKTNESYFRPERSRVIHFLNRAQLAARINVAESSLSRYDLPEPDAVIGPVNEDGIFPRGTSRGWTEQTIDKWDATRTKRGSAR